MIGSAKLRKRENENKTRGNWREEGRRGLPFSAPFSQITGLYSRVILACLSLTLKAWNRLRKAEMVQIGKTRKNQDGWTQVDVKNSATESESFEKRAQIFFVFSDDCDSKQEKTFALQSPW